MQNKRLEQLPKEFSKHFNLKVTKNMIDYCDKEVLPHYIFYKTIKKTQHGYCSYCKKEFTTTSLIEGKMYACPICKSECKVKAAGRKRTRMIDLGYFVYYKKSKADPKVMVVYGVIAVKDYTINYKNVETKFTFKSLYLLSPNGCSFYRRLAFYNQCNEFYAYHWEKAGSIYSEFNKDYIANIHHGYSRDSIKEAVKDTPLSWCGWEEYDHEDMIKFFALYLKYPVIEYLTKLGLERLVEEKLNNNRTYNAINWRGNTLYKVLKLTKSDLKEIKEKNLELTFEILATFRMGIKYNSNFTLSEAQILSEKIMYYGNYKTVIAALKYCSLRKFISYAERQYEAGKNKHYYSESQVFSTWGDYHSDCISLALDLNKDNIVFPKNLYQAHQNTIKQIKIKEDKDLNKKIKERLKMLNKKYTFEYNNFLIRPAKDSLELIEEGKALSHCVGTYAKKYADGKTVILLIRTLLEPEKPYYTVEIINNKIIQIRGKYNCLPDEAIKEFLKEFEQNKLNKTEKIKISA